MHGELLVNNFIQYFSKQRLLPKRMGWFDHSAMRTPVQNNFLEGTNAHVNGSDVTFRET